MLQLRVSKFNHVQFPILRALLKLPETSVMSMAAHCSQHRVCHESWSSKALRHWRLVLSGNGWAFACLFSRLLRCCDNCALCDWARTKLLNLNLMLLNLDLDLTLMSSVCFELNCELECFAACHSVILILVLHATRSFDKTIWHFLKLAFSETII